MKDTIVMSSKASKAEIFMAVPVCLNAIWNDDFEKIAAIANYSIQARTPRKISLQMQDYVKH